MLLHVHYGDGSILLINGNCQIIHIINYISKHCCLSSSIKFDLCLLNSGEALNLSLINSNVILAEKRRFPFHVHCVLTRIDDEGNHEPLLNDPKLITSEFLNKLKKTTTTKSLSKSDLKQDKQSKSSSSDEKQTKNVDLFKQSLSFMKFQNNKSIKKKF